MKFLIVWIVFFSLHSSEVCQFIDGLTLDQKKLMSDFLRATVQSFSGYTLFGDKPMALEGYAIYPFGVSFAPDPSTISKIKGMELWKALNIPNENREYLFLVFQDKNYCHMVCINRRAFLKAVNKNISLFRYVLGPHLTAEGLLQALIDSGNDFYNVLKDDNALLGILLGYGTQNSLSHARDEIVIDANGWSRAEQFPFLSQTTLMHSKALPQAAKNTPSFGFKTLDEEHSAFQESIRNSRNLKSFRDLQIPYFSCDPDLQETKDLLATYEQNRKEVMSALESENFLEKTLSKLFTATDGTMELPTLPLQHDILSPMNSAELLPILTSWIHKLANLEGGESLAKAYFRGVTDRENDEIVSSFSMEDMQLWQTEKDLNCGKNLAKADRFFHRLAKSQRALTSLVPNRVLYQTLLEGNKSPLSTKVKNVSLHYSFRFQGEKKIKHSGTVERENPELFIPGIAHALLGMKRGETREVFIHPAYGYGENSYFPPNLALIAKIHLIDFEEGENEICICPPHVLEKKDCEELNRQFIALKENEFYNYGLEFWSQIKKSGFFDYKTFEKHFNGEPRELDSVFQNVDQVCQFVNDLEYRLIL